MLNQPARFSLTAGKYAPLQTANSQNSGEKELLRKDTSPYRQTTRNNYKLSANKLGE